VSVGIKLQKGLQRWFVCHRW